jgi:hypothetical protein
VDLWTTGWNEGVFKGTDCFRGVGGLDVYPVPKLPVCRILPLCREWNAAVGTVGADEDGYNGLTAAVEVREKRGLGGINYTSSR